MAAPVIRAAPLWCDLGCGNGIAAASALGGPRGRAVLVDIADEALRQAEREIRADRTATLAPTSPPRRTCGGSVTRSSRATPAAGASPASRSSST